MPSRFPRATSSHLSAADAPHATTCYLQEERPHAALLPASLISLRQVGTCCSSWHACTLRALASTRVRRIL